MKKSIGNRSIRLVQMAAPLPIFFVLLLLCAAAFPQSAANPEFRLLQVDAGKVIGTIRSFQGLNGPPSPVMVGLPNLVEQYKELRVDQVRVAKAVTK